MSYGPSLAALHRRAAEFVDKILRGAKSGDWSVASGSPEHSAGGVIAPAEHDR
jgi:hypothetical protein